MPACRFNQVKRQTGWANYGPSLRGSTFRQQRQLLPEKSADDLCRWAGLREEVPGYLLRAFWLSMYGWRWAAGLCRGQRTPGHAARLSPASSRPAMACRLKQANLAVYAWVAQGWQQKLGGVGFAQQGRSRFSRPKSMLSNN